MYEWYIVRRFRYNAYHVNCKIECTCAYRVARIVLNIGVQFPNVHSRNALIYSVPRNRGCYCKYQSIARISARIRLIVNILAPRSREKIIRFARQCAFVYPLSREILIILTRSFLLRIHNGLCYAPKDTCTHTRARTLTRILNALILMREKRRFSYVKGRKKKESPSIRRMITVSVTSRS